MQTSIYSGYDYEGVWTDNENSNSRHGTVKLINADFPSFNLGEGKRFAFKTGVGF